MDSKLVEDVEARIEFIKLALKHCGKCEDETCSACGFYETELGILKRCLESLRWRTEGEPPVDVWVLFFRHSTGEYVVDIPHKDEMPGEWKRGGWTHWLPIPQ